MLQVDTPESVGLDASRWQSALALVRDWCDRDLIPAAALLVARSGKTTGPHLFGRQSLLLDSPPVREDAIFLIASITKPVVATGILRLVEAGQLSLGDRVTDFIREFGKNGKNGVTIRHLLTHMMVLPSRCQS